MSTYQNYKKRKASEEKIPTNILKQTEVVRMDAVLELLETGFGFDEAKVVDFIKALKGKYNCTLDAELKGKKHPGKTVRQVMEEDPDYIAWIRGAPGHAIYSPKVYHSIWAFYEETDFPEKNRQVE